jgi:hypothetical protein
MEQWRMTLYIDIRTLPLPAQCSAILAQVHRDFSLTLYYRRILIATNPVCRNVSESKYTPGVGASGARLKTALWADQ